ncbi:DUF5801 repeats-in-toxin domain-containing protein, partial [Sphingobium estronivorans]|uniref:DUF5801 repeats-in-toxin domain-containing protein n=2 Tax=Sphingobium estronivorans TaxID=1577690 RepID=UPI001F0784A5
TVTATQLDNYAHHPDITADDLAQLGHVGVVASDQDGDSATATVNLSVSDDVPSLTLDGPTSVVEGMTATGSWSEVIGADQPGASTEVLFGGNSYAVGAAIDTGLGILTVKADNSWTFVANNNLNNSLNPSISFDIKVTDADGDVAQHSQTVAITDGTGPTAGAPLSLQMDDQNLAGGTTQGNPDFVSGNVGFTAGSDALTGFAFATDLSALTGGLTWNRVSATLIEGWDGPVGTGTKIVALTLSAPASIGAGLSGNVQVVATQLHNYDSHPGINVDDSVNLGSVGVVASDQDGDSATATVNLSVSDDVPHAVDDGQIATVDDNAAGIVIGTVAGLLGNDRFGADGAGTPPIAIGTGSLGGTIAIVGGNLVYTSHHNITAPYASVGETFTYTIKDGDGDTSSATFSVLLTDTGPSIGAAAASFIVDEDGLANGMTQPVTGDVDGADTVKTGTLAGLNFGVDGPGNIALGAVADTGLRTLSDHVIKTVWDSVSHTLTGQDAVTGTNVFTLQITDVASGAYRFELLSPIKHSDPASEDNKILSVAVTVTDAENESASGTITVTINDDSPMVTASLPTAASLVVDETNLAADTTVSYAGNFAVLYGADGKGSLSYSLGVSGQGAATNIRDTATGNTVFLFLESGKVVGREGTSSANAAGGPVVFQLTVDALGAVTLDQQRAVLHTPDTGPNQAIGLDVGALITLTATAVDGDGDAVSQQINFGQTISFLDDAGTLGAFSNITVVNGANVVGNGTFSYNPGADGHGNFTITAPTLAGITYSTTQNATGALLTATSDPDGPGGNPPVTVFTLQVNADGTSVFTLVTPQAASSETISLLGLSSGGPTPFLETPDGRVEFTGSGSGVNSSTQGFGIANQFVANGESFTMEFHNPGQAGNQAANVNPEMVSSIVLKNDSINGSLNIKVTVYNDVTGQSEVVYTNLAVTGSSTTIDPVMSEFNRVSVEGVGGSGQGVRFTTLVLNKTILPADVDLHFTVQATDKDGDVTTTSPLNVFVDATSPTPPVAIDLNGDGLHFVGLAAGVSHDYGSGAVATAWVSSDDGLLAHATGNGLDIMFTDDAKGATSDLEGLRLAYDSNGDGKLDAGDAAFHEFGVWQDANGNGVVDPGEFKSLTDLGIASIDLTADGKGYQAANGEVTVLGEASFTRTDGTKGTVGDVIFATGSSSEASKTAENTSAGLNQALVAASLVAAVGAAETVQETQPASTTQQTAPVVTETAPASSATAEPTAAESKDSALAPADDQSARQAEQPAPQTSHASEEAAPDHARLSGGGAAHTQAADAAQTDHPSPGDHQGLLAQSINLPAFDGNAAAVLAAAVHGPAGPAGANAAAEVVKEALGTHDAPNIDALLAALPGGAHPVAPVLLNPVATEAVDSGHLAAAAAIFHAAMAAHEAMAVAHG